MKRLLKLRRYHLLWICLLVMVLLFGGMSYAQTGTPFIPGEAVKVGYDIGKIEGFIELIEQLLKTLYLIFFPLLAVGAAAMDNSLIYGGAFHLTPILFKFWQIIRTFCNFTIGLYFVGSILASFFGKEIKDKKRWIGGIIGAGIFVNLSRWIIAALIDLSTIATVTFGALPLRAFENDTLFKENVYYMKVYINMNHNTSAAQNQDQSDISLIYGCGTGEKMDFYLTCGINDGKLYENTNDPLGRKDHKQKFVDNRQNNQQVKTENISDNFCVYEKKLIQNEYGANISNEDIKNRLMQIGKDEGTKKCASISSILTKAVANTGPLYTIFTSILNVAEMGITSNTGDGKKMFVMTLIKLVFAFALIIPLLTFVVVMVVRAIYFRAIIVFSPLIVLARALSRGDTIKSKIGSMGGLENIFNPSQIISLAFLPAIATFGLSISILFLTLLTTLPLTKPGGDLDAFSLENKSTDEAHIYEGPVVSLSFEKDLRALGIDIGNLMSRLVINFLGIALMWMVVFATLKTNKFTEAIADKAQKRSQEFLTTVPLPFMGGVGLNAIGEIPDTLKRKYIDIPAREQENIIGQKMAELGAGQAKEAQDIKQNYESAAIGGEKGTNATQTQQDAFKNLEQFSSPALAPNTNYQDYQAGARAYAQKAKQYYTTSDEGKKYVEELRNKNRPIDLNSLDTIKDRNDAMQNEAFIHRSHTKDADPNGKGYDEFSKNRDNKGSSKADQKTIKMQEENLTEMLKNKQTKFKKNGLKHWYLYGHNDNWLTVFDHTTKSSITATTYPITDPDGDITKITKQDIHTFNNALFEFKDQPTISSLPLYTLLSLQPVDAEITVEGKQYKKQANGLWEEPPTNT